MMRTEWPEVESFLTRREIDSAGERVLLVGQWPEYIAVADELFTNYDPRWVRQSADYVWFILNNGFAQYRIIDRDEWFEETLCHLEDGILL